MVANQRIVIYKFNMNLPKLIFNSIYFRSYSLITGVNMLIFTFLNGWDILE